MEAMAIADRIVTMNLGEIQQIDAPEYVYHNPVNMFVANFLGSPGMNFIDCSLEANNTLKLGLDGKILQINEKIVKKIKAVGEDKAVLMMGIRPEDIKLSFKKNVYGFDMKVTIVEEIGPENIVNLRAGDHVVKVLTDPDILPKTGETVWAVPDQDKIRIFDQQTKKEIL